MAEAMTTLRDVDQWPAIARLLSPGGVHDFLRAQGRAAYENGIPTKRVDNLWRDKLIEDFRDPFDNQPYHCVTQLLALSKCALGPRAAYYWTRAYPAAELFVKAVGLYASSRAAGVKNDDMEAGRWDAAGMRLFDKTWREGPTLTPGHMQYGKAPLNLFMRRGTWRVATSPDTRETPAVWNGYVGEFEADGVVGNYTKGDKKLLKTGRLRRMLQNMFSVDSAEADALIAEVEVKARRFLDIIKEGPGADDAKERFLSDRTRRITKMCDSSGLHLRVAGPPLLQEVSNNVSLAATSLQQQPAPALRGTFIPARGCYEFRNAGNGLVFTADLELTLNWEYTGHRGKSTDHAIAASLELVMREMHLDRWLAASTMTTAEFPTARVPLLHSVPAWIDNHGYSVRAPVKNIRAICGQSFEAHKSGYMTRPTPDQRVLDADTPAEERIAWAVQWRAKGLGLLLQFCLADDVAEFNSTCVRMDMVYRGGTRETYFAVSPDRCPPLTENTAVPEDEYSIAALICGISTPVRELHRYPDVLTCFAENPPSLVFFKGIAHTHCGHVEDGARLAATAHSVHLVPGQTPAFSCSACVYLVVSRGASPAARPPRQSLRIEDVSDGESEEDVQRRASL